MLVSRLILSTALAVAVTPAPAAAAATPSWDHPGYDAEDSHFNPLETQITIDTIPQVTKRWQVTLRTSARSCAKFARPVLADGRLHVGDQLGISTYDVKTGQSWWRYDWADLGDTGTPRLAVSGGLLIAAGNDCRSPSDPDGYLIAVDARTGLPRWRLNLDIPVHSVAVDEDTIVVSGGSPSDADLTTARAVRDGRHLWSRPNTLTSEVSAAGRILARTTDGDGTPTGTSMALSVVDGREHWSHEGTWTAQTADPHGEWFYATGDSGTLSAVRVSTGAVRWTIPSPSAADRPLLAADWTRLYQVSGKTVTAWNTADGRTAWTTTQPTEGAQPIRVGGLLYTGGPVLNPDNGKPAGPTYPGDVLIAAGRLHQLNKGTLTTRTP